MNKPNKQKLITLEKETNTINPLTGDTDVIRQEFTRVVERDKFMQVYLEDISSFIGLNSKIDFKVLLSIWSKSEYGTNKIILVKSIKEEISKELGYKYQSVANSISSLSKKKILVREGTSVYYLHPKYFFKGTRKNRQECFEYLIRYKLID